jgi:hypothetical protein
LKKYVARLHLPFITDLTEKSPMDILKEKSDIRGMDKLLENLTPYGVDHHSREIKHLFALFVKNRLPCLNAYL